MTEKSKNTEVVKKKTTKKKIAKTAETGEIKPKKLSICVEKALYREFIEYIEKFGYHKDGFVSDAIREKLDRDRISRMIDTMVKH